MQKVYGYVRVSTTKQGDGVSLDAQKESIENYAKHKNLEIIHWFTEKQTAAKVGRPEFEKMLRLIEKKKSDGAIFHKIDRATRNHTDWARIIELRDNHDCMFLFSADDIDMSTRAGRLLADIIMSIAKGYIDNLREETMKGLYGRLKQGIYPFKAPRGYLNTGGGNIKTFDPVLAPLIKEAFELYAEGNQSLSEITIRLASKGLISSNGNPISKNILSLILHNPFYIGLMKVKGEMFKGKHEPLISDKLFNEVQRKFEGTTVAKCKHDHLYRRSIKCVCGFGLVSELQSGRVYYRCQNKLCDEKTMREDRVSYVIEKYLKSFILDSRVIKLIQYQISLKTDFDNVSGKEVLKNIKLQLSNTESRFEKLTNLLLDGIVENSDYLKKKEQLLKEQSLLQEQEKIISKNVNNGVGQRIQKLLENSQSLYQQYSLGNKHQKRSLLKKTFSKLELMGGRLVIETNKPYLLLLDNPSVLSCCQACYTEWNKKENFSPEEIKKIADGFIEYATTEC